MPPVSSRTTTMSTPSSSSDLIGEAPSAAACGRTGRRLANRPSALRIASRPCSGRTLALGSDHLGPPTAPSRIASAFFAASRVDAGSGSPWRSMAMPPMSCSWKEKTWPWRAAMASSTGRVAETISGPMPSPGSTTMFACMGVPRDWGMRAGARAYSAASAGSACLVAGGTAAARSRAAASASASATVSGRGGSGVSAWRRASARLTAASKVRVAAGLLSAMGMEHSLATGTGSAGRGSIERKPAAGSPPAAGQFCNRSGGGQLLAVPRGATLAQQPVGHVQPGQGAGLDDVAAGAGAFVLVLAMAHAEAGLAARIGTEADAVHLVALQAQLHAGGGRQRREQRVDRAVALGGLGHAAAIRVGQLDRGAGALADVADRHRGQAVALAVAGVLHQVLQVGVGDHALLLAQRLEVGEDHVQLGLLQVVAQRTQALLDRGAAAVAAQHHLGVGPAHVLRTH